MRVGAWILGAERHFHINYKSICMKYRLPINVKVSDLAVKVLRCLIFSFRIHYIFSVKVFHHLTTHLQSLAHVEPTVEKLLTKFPDLEPCSVFACCLFTNVALSQSKTPRKWRQSGAEQIHQQKTKSKPPAGSLFASLQNKVSTTIYLAYFGHPHTAR